MGTEPIATKGSRESFRLFVAVELPRPVLDALGEAQSDLADQAARAGIGRICRWTSLTGSHLTLKFLGDTSTGRVPDLAAELLAGLAGQAPVALELAGLGAFPSLRAPRVVWVGLAGALAELGLLQRRVEAALVPLGFPSEGRPFAPHLTLARVAEYTSAVERQALGEIVRVHAPPPSLPLVAEVVSLMRSELGPGGARYTRLAEIRLRG